LNRADIISIIPEMSLALSGGGFRATFFHAGVVRALIRIGLKNKIKLISSVSGASILNALLGLHFDKIHSLTDYDILILNPLIRLTAQNPRGRILASLPGGLLRSLSYFSPTLLQKGIALISGNDSAAKMASLLDSYLYQGKTLADLSSKIRIVINATNLNTGVRWRFEREDFGDYKTGYSYDVNKVGLSVAVTASAAHPLLIRPVQIKTNNITFYYRNSSKIDKGINTSPPPVVCLADGGIYDNLGLYAIERDCKINSRFVIVSDAAQRFDIQEKNFNRTNSAMRIVTIMMEESDNRKRREIFNKISSGTWTGIIFKLGNSCDYYRNFDHPEATPSNEMPQALGWDNEVVKLLGSMRTDLDRFHQYEIDCLVYHGESLIDTLLMKWHMALFKTIIKTRNYHSLEKPGIPQKELIRILSKSSKHIRL